MVPVVGSHIILDQLQEIYIESYLNAFVEQVRVPLHVPDTAAEHDYLLQRIPLVATQQTFFFVLFTKLNRACVGAIEIRGHEHPGQLYCWLHPAYWGKSYFQEALQLAAHIYFSVTQALYFTARVDSDNMRSYYALKKNGFADYRLVDGAYGKQYELILRKAVKI